MSEDRPPNALTFTTTPEGAVTARASSPTPLILSELAFNLSGFGVTTTLGVRQNTRNVPDTALLLRLQVAVEREVRKVLLTVAAEQEHLELEQILSGWPQDEGSAVQDSLREDFRAQVNALLNEGGGGPQ